MTLRDLIKRNHLPLLSPRYYKNSKNIYIKQFGTIAILYVTNKWYNDPSQQTYPGGVYDNFTKVDFKNHLKSLGVYYDA